MAEIAEAKGKDGDELEVMTVVLEGRFATTGDDGRHSKHRDPLSAGILSHRVVLYDGSIWRLVAVPVYSAHTERAQ